MQWFIFPQWIIQNCTFSPQSPSLETPLIILLSLATRSENTLGYLILERAFLTGPIILPRRRKRKYETHVKQNKIVAYSLNIPHLFSVITPVYPATEKILDCHDSWRVHVFISKHACMCHQPSGGNPTHYSLALSQLREQELLTETVVYSFSPNSCQLNKHF